MGGDGSTGKPVSKPVRASLARRDFLKGAAATAAGLALGCGSDGGGAALDASPADAAMVADAAAPDATPPDPPETVQEVARFALGIASGDVTSTRATVWAHYENPTPMAAGVWEMDGETYARTVWEGPVEPAAGGFVHVDIDGLVGGRRYRYAFFEMNAGQRIGRSPIGTFRAALAADQLEPLVIGATTCADNGRDFKTLRHAGARSDFDLFLLNGDTVYTDGADDLASYRAKWSENLSTAAFRDLRRATSVLATWDDHEIVNNWNGEDVDPGLWSRGTRAFFENLPLRRHETEPDRVWKSIRWGKTAEIFVLDCRGERKPSTRGSDSPEYISPAQMAWLKTGLTASDAVFKLIMNSVPIGNFPLAFDTARADRWEGYGIQRTEILSHIDDGAITGVIWIGGDFHLASLGRVDKSGPGSTQLEALVGPAAQTGNILAAGLGGAQFDWATSKNSYTAIHLDPATSTVMFRFWGDVGSVLHEQSYSLA